MRTPPLGAMVKTETRISKLKARAAEDGYRLTDIDPDQMQETIRAAAARGAGALVITVKANGSERAFTVPDAKRITEYLR